MIIYAAILSILTIVTINSVFSATRSFAEFRVSRDLNYSATSVMERLSREIRNAYAADNLQSSFNVNPGHLTLQKRDSLGQNVAVEFYVENGRLKIKENGIATGSLTASSTAVNNFTVRSISGPRSSAIKAELQLTAERRGVSKTGNFYTTIILRDSY